MVVWEYHYCDVTNKHCERGACSECPKDSVGDIITWCKHFKIRKEGEG